MTVYEAQIHAGPLLRKMHICVCVKGRFLIRVASKRERVAQR